MRAALIAFALICVACARPAAAEVEKCPDLVASRPPFLKAALTPDKVRLTFIGHASFLIETPGGTTAITDYNDYMRMPLVPVIATMNKAHSTHYSTHPDPGIRRLLRGWRVEGDQPRWDVTEGDLHVRNTSAIGRAARRWRAIPSSSSRWPACASPISAICTTG